MAVDFGKIFGSALRYPFRKDVYFLLFAFSLIFGLSAWFITGYLIGDIGGVGVNATEVAGKLISSIIYLVPVTIVGWLVGIFLMTMYFDNSMWFYKGKRKQILESLYIAKERFFYLTLT